MLGLECACIFAIFTSQAWNMTFSLYQSLTTVPHELREAAAMAHLSPWRRFWKLELPFATPGLIWNMMMSVSGGWFFVVAAEAITVSGQEVMLPGIGSYIAVAINAKDLAGIGWAILTMLIVILLYDQFAFRPLIAWAHKFRLDAEPGEIAPRSWVLSLFRKARLVRALKHLPSDVATAFPRARLPSLEGRLPAQPTLTGRARRVWDRVWSASLVVLSLACAGGVAAYVHEELGWGQVAHAFLLGLPTATRVIVLIALSSLVWVPVGVLIGLRPRVAQALEPVIQFLAAFPANLLFPLVVIAIVHWDLNVNVWTSPLMVLGTQWYILFNVIAGASVLPRELLDAAGSMGVRRWLWWRKVALPGVFPAYVTGAITAAGGCWNASIVAEVVSWGPTTLEATGLGAYITEATRAGEVHRVALGVSVMCVYVLLFNRFFWRRLQRLAERRFHLE